MNNSNDSIMTYNLVGKDNKLLKKLVASVLKGNETSNLFLLRDERQIGSIVQVISTTRDYPMIGNFFTKKDKRNNGFGYKLLQLPHDFLKHYFEKIGLVSDTTNPASNKILNIYSVSSNLILGNSLKR